MLQNEIRLAVRRQLRIEHAAEPDTLIRDELGICLGETRMDVAAINGQISGYEIKGDSDRLSRLARQVGLYGRVVDRAVLVTEGRFASQAPDLVPDWWGVWTCLPNGRWPRIQLVRPASINPSIDPYAVVQLLWRDEALAALTAHGLDAGLRTAGRWKLWEALAAQLSPVEIGATVRASLQFRARRGW